jgi:Chalcone isomerase-like
MPILLKIRLACAGLLMASMVMPAAAQLPPALPEAVTRDVAGLRLQGDGVLRFFGLKVYDIRLWAPKKAVSIEEHFALELVYDLAIKGRDIAERSVKEMRGQGWRDEAKLKRWGEEMARVFPDIKQGDALIGVSVPGKEARFYSRDRLIAVIPDPEFARAFFDIWLSEKTSEPKLRNKLLGAN